MLKLYLARHGETDANHQGVYYGRSDVPLSAAGIVQSRLLANKLAEVSFDSITTSTLQRTKQTAKFIASGRHTLINAVAEFDELNFGDWEGRHFQDLIKQDSDRYDAWCKDWINLAPPNGESFKDFKQRVDKGLRHLLHTCRQGSVLLIGHQGVLKVIMLLLLKAPEQAFWQFTFDHGAYSLLNIVQGHAVIEKINAG